MCGSPTDMAAKAASKANNKSPPVPNGPVEASGSAPGSRPGSRSSFNVDRPRSGGELDKDAAVADAARREQAAKEAAVASAVSAASAVQAASRRAITPSADERQIIRVPQQATLQVPGGAKPHHEPISPPTSTLSGQEKVAQFLKQQQLMDAQKQGLSLDYVKQKIVEEMKKGEDGTGASAQQPGGPSSSPSPLAAGSKRPSSESNPAAAATNSAATGDGKNDDMNSAKKPRLDSKPSLPVSTSSSSVPVSPRPPNSAGNQLPSSGPPSAPVTPPASVANAPQPSAAPPNVLSAPDSPGSEGEMVIDESAGPDSVGNEVKPANSPPTPTTSSAQPPTSSSSNCNSMPNKPTPTSTASATSAPPPPPPTAPSKKPTYEPLSDDD